MREKRCDFCVRFRFSLSLFGFVLERGTVGALREGMGTKLNAAIGPELYAKTTQDRSVMIFRDGGYATLAQPCPSAFVLISIQDRRIYENAVEASCAGLELLRKKHYKREEYNSLRRRLGLLSRVCVSGASQ